MVPAEGVPAAEAAHESEAVTPDDVASRVARVRDLVDDAETAHIEEDRLYREVLAAIANGAPDAQALADKALETQWVEFVRWYA